MILPPEIVGIIIDFYVGLHAYRIQKWWRASRRCEDCRRRVHHSLLHEMPACADFQVARMLCCTKRVCRTCCRFQCPQGHLNFIFSDDGYYRRAKCRKCGAGFTPDFQWHGLGLDDARRMWGYE